MPKVEVFTLKSEHDGLDLSVMTVVPEGEIRGLMQLAHGMAEHKERYLPVMECLAKEGIACIINDHRGHGASVRSPEDLGYFYKDGANGLVKDMHQLTLWFRAQHPGKRLVLFGHSMGSLAARAYIARFGRDIDALILSGSPGYNPMAKAGLLLTRILTVVHGSSKARSPLMNKILNGTFSARFKSEGSEFAWLSPDPEHVRAYEADPLCGFPFTLNGYRALLNLMLDAYDRRLKLRRDLPVHFMSGEDDPCAPNRAGFDAAVANLRDRGCIYVTSHMYPGHRHEILPKLSLDLAKLSLDAIAAAPDRGAN